MWLSPSGWAQPLIHYSSIPGDTMNGERKKHYPVIVEQDADGAYIVECPVFQGCRSYGMTLDEALANIREAIEVCVDEGVEDASETVFVGVRDIELGV